MKIFGYEGHFEPVSTEITLGDVSELLDAMHGALISHDEVYSADLVAEGVSSLSILLGVKVGDSDDANDALSVAEALLKEAFAAAGGGVLIHATRSVQVRELVPVC
jgi:hypothetical protein